MSSLRDIRRRITGIKNTSKITQAMKMVAAAKLRRAQDAILSARPYAKELNSLIRYLLSFVDRGLLPILQDRPDPQSALVVVVTADRGLCGPFNTNIIRLATQVIHEKYGDLHAQGKVKVVCIGRRGHLHFSARRYPIADSYIGEVNDPTLGFVQKVLNNILSPYMAGEYDRVEIVYNEFKSVLQQNLRSEQLLPLPAEPEPKREVQGKQMHEFIDYIYEPSELELLGSLIPRHINYQIWRVLLESNAAEQGARMTAMESATKNANDLVKSLQLSYNKARQAGITKEILEIVSGADALKKSST